MAVNILITDGISPAAPIIIETLKKLGHNTFCCDETKWNASFYSKYLDKKIVCSSSEKQPERFLEELTDIILRYDIEILIPVRDVSIDVVSKNIAKLSNLRIKMLIPDYETWLNGAEKIKTMKLAQKFNIPIPKTLFDTTLEYEFICSSIGNPFLVKLNQSSGARGVFKVSNENEFHQVCNKIKKTNKLFYYQEFIPEGRKSFNCSYMYDLENKLLGWCMFEQIRTIPFKGGTTSFGISTYNEAALLLGKQMLDQMNWVGPAALDILEDPRDGKLKIIEVNPRFWTGLLLDVSAGINYLELMINAIQNNKQNGYFKYKTGQTYSFLPYELIHLLYKLNPKALRSFFPFKGHTDVFIKPRDPMLFIGLIIQSLYILIKKNKKYIRRQE